MPPTKLQMLLALATLLGALDAAHSQPQTARDQYGDPLPAGAKARLGSLRWRHSNVTGFVAFLPDGKSVVSADGDQVFHVWEFPSGKELRRFGPGVNPDPATRARIAQFVQYGLNGLPVALSPDGKILACNFDAADVLLYDVASGKQVAKLGQPGDLSRLTFSPDSKQLAVRDLDGELRVWDWAQAKTLRVMRLGGAGLFDSTELLYAPDGKLLATLVYEEAPNNMAKSIIRLLDPATGDTVHSIALEIGEFLEVLCFAPDSKSLACRGESGAIRVFDVNTGKQLQVLKEKRGGSALVFSKGGKSLFTRDYGSLTVQEWDLASGKQVRSLDKQGFQGTAALTMPLTAPALSPDGTILAIAGDNHALQFIDLATGKEVYRSGSATVSCGELGFSVDGSRVWTQHSGELLQWDASTGKELERIALPTRALRSVVSADGKYLASEPRGKKAGSIMSIATGKQVGELAAGTAANQPVGATSVVFAPDTSLLALRRQREQRLELCEVPARADDRQPNGAARHGAQFQHFFDRHLRRRCHAGSCLQRARRLCDLGHGHGQKTVEPVLQQQRAGRRRVPAGRPRPGPGHERRHRGAVGAGQRQGAARLRHQDAQRAEGPAPWRRTHGAGGVA
jgi:WD40 repeat protein